MTMDEQYGRGIEKGKTIYLHLGSHNDITIKKEGGELYRTPKQLSLFWDRDQFLNAYNTVETQQQLEALVNSAEPAQP